MVGKTRKRQFLRKLDQPFLSHSPSSGFRSVPVSAARYFTWNVKLEPEIGEAASSCSPLNPAVKNKS